MKKTLITLITLSLSTSTAQADSYQSFPEYKDSPFTQQESVAIVKKMLAFMENLKQGNKEAVAAQIEYPFALALGMNIASPEELLKHYDWIFTPKVVEELTSNIDITDPMFHRNKGCFINHGYIWFSCNAEGVKAKVFNRLDSIHEKDILKAKFPDAIGYAEAGWKYEGDVLSPTCLYQPWWSWDDYKCYAAHYKIENDTLLKNIGQYWGDIVPLEAIDCGEPRALFEKVDECNKASTERYTEIIKGKYSTAVRYTDGGSDQYNVLVRWGKDKCKEAVPHLVESCQEVVLVSYGANGEGTLSTEDTTMYALLQTDEGALIVPAKNYYEW